jgi:hypothetical protein
VYRWKREVREDWEVLGSYRLTDQMAQLLGAQSLTLDQLAQLYGYEPLGRAELTSGKDEHYKDKHYMAPDPHLKTWPFRVLYDNRTRFATIQST